ncbi:matrix-remodeling-associated protein 5 [Trichosurus vulpecula]|uniref:matrix-remodeling-associated protein 5 n=1 Tax=Trichosurus vulpecula TaxID=9337 RepID=UPI00186B5599|nr:matrix-remodeling-associated protein 5 [Trichosurus vulpecula]
MKFDKMQKATLEALSVVLILFWGHPQDTLACPHPCACYVPTEVHCTFRSLASVPARISKHVERINLGFNSIQSISENSFAGLTKLELLMIHGNDIPSIPNGALKDLISLQVFKFSYNKLRVITAQTLQGLSSLMRLHIDHNKIEFIHPQAFNGLTSLRLLHLEGNLLHQLHPSTFSTFAFLDYFRLSTIRHLYLSENVIRTLPVGMLSNMPLLENLYLHGNPWSCDCGLKWLLEWDARSKGILKCKKDKAYEGGQLCSTCSSPKQLNKQEIHNLKDILCTKPIIQSPLKQNFSSSNDEEEGEEEEEEESSFSLEEVQFSPWNITLNMTDEHGNTVNLACEIKKPTDVSKIQLNQSDPQEIDINATIALELQCPMNRENYEKLWKLIAYYSEVPVTLQREIMLSKDPKVSYQYRQDTNDDALYYTGVKAQILAEPSWVMQPSIDIQLNRLQSTAKKVLLSLYTQFSQIIPIKDLRQQKTKTWVMIEQGEKVKTAQTVVEGSVCQLSCNVKASESPVLLWMLPDGSMLKAPFNDQDSRFSVLSSGQLIIKSVGRSDSGLYQCVAQVRDEMDRMIYRVSVQPSVIQPTKRHITTIEKNPEESVTLPCNALAIPDAELSWLLPNKQILNGLSNSTHAYMLENGTLFIPSGQSSDSGYYKCIAINQQGVDHFIVKVTVNKKGGNKSSKRGQLRKRLGSKTASKIRDNIIEDEGGSGMEETDYAARRMLTPKDQEVSSKPRSDAVSRTQNKKNKKGRRKMKHWKDLERAPESNVAEGRRVFESRRRINMANKQINPQHWADILAKVRGKNLPKSTAVPHTDSIIKTTVASSVRQKATVPPPISSPPLKHAVQITPNTEESSASEFLFNEDELVSVTISSASTERSDSRTLPAEPEITQTHVEEAITYGALGTPKPPYVAETPSTWIEPTTTFLPSKSISFVPHLNTFSEDPTNEEITESWSTIDNTDFTAGSVSNQDELPLDTIILAESETVTYLYPGLKTDSQVNKGHGKDPPSIQFIPLHPAGVNDVDVPKNDSKDLDPPALQFEDLLSGDHNIPTHQHPQVKTKKAQKIDNRADIHDNSSVHQHTNKKYETTQEAEKLGKVPMSNRISERPRQDAVSTTALSELSYNVVSTVIPLTEPEQMTSVTTNEKLTTTAAITTAYTKNIPTSSLITQHHPRRRPNGRKRLRPHKLHRKKPALPTTFSPAETSFSPRIFVTEPNIADKADISLVSAPWVENQTTLPKQLERKKYVETATKGVSRRKFSKRPKLNQAITTTVASFDTETETTNYPTNKLTIPVTATLQTTGLLATAPLTTEASHEKRPKGYVTTTPFTTEIHLSHHPVQETTSYIYKNLSDVDSDHEEIESDYGVTDLNDYETRTVAPSESLPGVVSPSDSVHSEVTKFQKASLGLESSSTSSWVPKTMVQTTLSPVIHPGVPVTSSQETSKDSSVFKESQRSDFPSKFVSPTEVPVPSQQEEKYTSSVPSSKKKVYPSGEIEITAKESPVGQDPKKTASAVTHSIRLDKYVVTPKPSKEVISIIPPSPSPAEQMPSPIALVPFTESTTIPSLHFSRTSSTPTQIPMESKENIIFNHVGAPESKISEIEDQKAKLIFSPNEFPTPNFNQNRINLPSKQEQFKEIQGSSSNNRLLQGSDPPYHPGRMPVFHQRPAIVPEKHELPRVTVRPSHVPTQGSSKHFLTFQPSLSFTNKPEITSYPMQNSPEKKLPEMTTVTMTTTTIPLPRPNPIIPNRSGHPGTNQFNTNPKVFGNNYIPEQKVSATKMPSPRIPYTANGRFPFLFNRTPTFTQVGVTPKPPATALPVSVSTREKQITPGSYSQITTQSTIHNVIGIAGAPSIFHGPSTRSPPLINLRNTPPVFPTRRTIPHTASTIHSYRNVHHSNSKITFSGGPPAPSFWALGGKPHIITKSPHTLSIIAETDVVLPCDATGEPKPFVTWTKVSTGALMTPNTRTQRFEVLKNGTFIIRNVQLQDRGQYMCTAKNLHGVDKMIVTLSVTAQQPQIIASHYQDVTVYLGDTIAMECLAKGTPPPQISWIFPDRKVWRSVSTAEARIMLHENRTLTIKDATFSDRGVYKCIASNAAGADSLAIRLHVVALPPIIHQERQENISLPPGLSIHIHCTAKAAPLPSIRWVIFDGTQIRPSQFINGNLFVFPNGTLYIRNISPKDSGNYECVAANMVGSARRTVHLNVQKTSANAKITGSSPHKTDITYGGTLRLNCTASGDPWPRILWRLPSKRMIDSLFSFDTRIKVFGNGTLLVHSVTDKDAGDYLCVARNKIGDDYVVLKVNVMMKPAKIEHKKENDHKVIYGGDLKVDCVATGLPNPEISWSLPDGSMVNTFMQSDDSGGRTKRYVVFNNGTLYFNEVGMREEGDYTCFAENQIGKDEMKVHVKVVAEPAAIHNKTYSIIHVPYGDVVTVACEAKGEPTPKVTWLSPTNRLIPISSDKYQVFRDGTLLIQKAQRSDSGNYTCVVRNSAGEDRKIVWIHVNVQSPTINGHPNAITTVREIAARESRKLIDCKAEGIPAPRVLWAFPEGVILPAPYYGNRITVHRNGTLDIRSLRKTDSVQLVCIGRNEGGEAKLIVQLTVMDPLEKPVFRNPVSEKITAMAGHTINLNCSAEGSPEPNIVWILPNGTELQSGKHLQRFYHKKDGMLHISSLSAADAGAYRCVARNKAGYTERLVSLKVGLKPEISNQYPKLVSIINGETLQLHCITQGSQKAQVSWTLPSGMVLEGPQVVGRVSLLENGSLTVHEASVFDRGTYLCKVETEYGSSVMSVPVIVIAYPPRITSEPTPVIYTRPGNTVKMNCMAIGIPKAEIMWELPDKSHLTAGAQSRLYGNKLLHPQGSLIIHHSTQRDAGFYKCTAKNILGSDSKTTYIHVF